MSLSARECCFFYRKQKFVFFFVRKTCFFPSLFCGQIIQPHAQASKIRTLYIKNDNKTRWIDRCVGSNFFFNVRHFFPVANINECFPIEIMWLKWKTLKKTPLYSKRNCMKRLLHVLASHFKCRVREKNDGKWMAILMNVRFEFIHCSRLQISYQISYNTLKNDSN